MPIFLPFFEAFQNINSIFCIVFTFITFLRDQIITEIGNGISVNIRKSKEKVP